MVHSTISDDFFNGLRICVLQPDYSTTNIDYQYYDPPRQLNHLIPQAHFDHILLNKLTTYRQLKELSKKKYDVFVNLCEGYLEWEVPSIDVIYALELLDLPFTGPTTSLYDPPKELMKYVAFTAGVHTPAYVLVNNSPEALALCTSLRWPLFVKPHKAGDSLGIDEHSLAYNMEQLTAKVDEIAEEYAPLLVEEYIAGREFTVMLAAAPGTASGVTVFEPVEYIFPAGKSFKTYSLKTSELHPESNIKVSDQAIVTQLKDAAIAIFNGFDGAGYARLDFRMNEKGELFFLEINFTCSVFYSQGYEGSADYILQHDGFGQANFLKLIVAEGIARYKARHKKYQMRGNSIAGYGIYATTEIQQNELIFKGEEKAQRMVTRRWVASQWNAVEKDNFARYAYPLSSEVFLLWDNNPAGWAPQNHSCSPNTEYDGLNVVATRFIAKGEELTLDYASFLDEHMQPFECQCGAPNCRKTITGLPSNSVTEREKLRQS
jgi:D-alanine-D-alanine ligase